MSNPTIEQSTTTRAHAHKWLVDSGLGADKAAELLSASQHNAGHLQGNGDYTVLFTLAHSTRHGFQQNTWTVRRPLRRAMGIDSIELAHVADAVERISGGEVNSYDATADFAYNLLDTTASLSMAAKMYAAGDMSEKEFDEQVRTAIDTAGE